MLYGVLTFFCCGNCGNVKSKGTESVWVPYYWHATDALEVLEDMLEQGANKKILWCESCALLHCSRYTNNLIKGGDSD